MSIDYVDFLVEEPSMELFLRALLPKLLGAIHFEIYPFQGKTDLLQRLPERLRGYAAWLPANHRIVIIVDRDDDDCLKLKAQLEEQVRQAGLWTRQQNHDFFSVINRIAIEELEAWYFGDWEAVCAAFPRLSPTIPQQAKYRNPDAIAGGTWEAFEHILKRAGYFPTGLRKLELARTITPYMDPTRNRSRSFQALRHALQSIATT
jgi:hypothetical protein